MKKSTMRSFYNNIIASIYKTILTGVNNSSFRGTFDNPYPRDLIYLRSMTGFVWSQVWIVLLIVKLIKIIFKMVIPTYIPFGIIVLGLLIVGLYYTNERVSDIVFTYDNKPLQEKRKWGTMSLLLMLIPVFIYAAISIKTR